MDSPELKVITGEKANLEIGLHQENFVQGYAQEMAGVRHGARAQIMDLIGPELNLEPELETRRAKYRKVIEASKENNSLVLIKSGEELAAIGRYLPVPGHNDLFELGSVYTYPNFRGLGLSKIVRKEVLKSIRAKHGSTARVILATKSDQIKATNQGPECKTIPYQEYLDACGYSYDANALQQDIAAGWVGIFIDLNKTDLN